jgi:hypothetical protein
VRGSAREVVLIDRTRARARAVATDLRYGAPAFEGCLERGITDHLGGRNRKSHPCAMAIPLWQSVNSADENEVLSRSLRGRYIDILDASA